MRADTPLRFAFASNSIFSSCCAVLMLFCPSAVGRWLGVEAPVFLQLIGAGLVIFASALVFEATRPRMASWHALVASAADFGWVLCTVGLVLAAPGLFSSSGKTLVLAVAGAVLGFGVWQIWAAGLTHQTGVNGKYRHCILVETDAPADRLWEIVSDMGSLQRYAPMLVRSAMMDGQAPGVDAIRRCEDKAGKRWAEQCVELVPGQRLILRFLTEAPNFPFPAKEMRGGWEILPTDRGSTAMLWWELVPKGPIPAALILLILAFRADRDMPLVIQRMAAAARGDNPDATKPTRKSEAFRILPTPC